MMSYPVRHEAEVTFKILNVSRPIIWNENSLCGNDVCIENCFGLETQIIFINR